MCNICCLIHYGRTSQELYSTCPPPLARRRLESRERAIPILKNTEGNRKDSRQPPPRLLLPPPNKRSNISKCNTCSRKFLHLPAVQYAPLCASPQSAHTTSQSALRSPDFHCPHIYRACLLLFMNHRDRLYTSLCLPSSGRPGLQPLLNCRGDASPSRSSWGPRHSVATGVGREGILLLAFGGREGNA
jgi:hypothetical protein